MRYIAIIKNRDAYLDADIYGTVVQSITDWYEVTDEEFNLLSQWARNYNYQILERMDKQKEFIPKTVKAALVEAKAYEEKLAKQKEEAERKKQERLLKKKAKDEAAEKKLLESLKEKYGDK